MKLLNYSPNFFWNSSGRFFWSGNGLNPCPSSFNSPVFHLFQSIFFGESGSFGGDPRESLVTGADITVGDVAIVDVLEIVVVLTEKFVPIFCIELCFFTLQVSNFFLKSGVRFSSRAFEVEAAGPVEMDLVGQFFRQESSFPIRLNAIPNFNSFINY